jgi:hypothetical protein
MHSNLRGTGVGASGYKRNDIRISTSILGWYYTKAPQYITIALTI